MPSSTPIGPLLQTVFTSILEVFLLCLAGYVLAGRGILDKKTQKQINRLNVSLFTPSLLFSKVAFFLSPARLRELWIIPIFFVIVTTFSMSISFLLGRIFRLRSSQRKFAMAAAMFMNSNSLPIALMQSLVITVPGLQWGKTDNKNAMLGRALTYLVLYSTLGMVLRWSYGVRLLSQADDEPAFRDHGDAETSALLGSYETDQCIQCETTYSTVTQVDEYPEGMPGSRDEQCTPTIVVEDSARLLAPRANQFYKSFPNSPNQSQVRLKYSRLSTTVSPSSTPVDSEDEDSDEGEESMSFLPTRHHHISTPTPIRLFFHRCWRRISLAWSALNDFMTVPLWAALASLTVACIQPIQHALEWHMQPVKGALTVAGNCSIPLTLVVLGAYFYPTPPSVEDVHKRSGLTPAKSSSTLVSSVKDLFKLQNRRGNRSNTVDRPGETKTVVIAVMSRMIITPMLLLPLMALSTRFDLHSVFEDPVFVVSNVLLISSPPALTLAQITQASSGDAFERLISRTIFWSYCVVTPPATIITVVLGLLLAKL